MGYCPVLPPSNEEGRVWATQPERNASRGSSGQRPPSRRQPRPGVRSKAKIPLFPSLFPEVVMDVLRCGRGLVPSDWRPSLHPPFRMLAGEVSTRGLGVNVHLAHVGPPAPRPVRRRVAAAARSGASDVARSPDDRSRAAKALP